jgi:pimeloyl-ACP methyl ester carboxylesterase
MLTGVVSHTADTDRLRVHYLEAGSEGGIPVVLVHGNLSTGRFFEPVMSGAPERFRVIAPDMRGFGDTEFVPIDATRGLRDWADDTHALVRALGIGRPVHLAG